MVQVESQSSSKSRRVDASKARLFGLLEATGISLTAFFATFHLSTRDLTRVDKCFDAVVRKGSSVAVHAVPQRGALQPVLAAIFAIGLCAKVLFGLGNFSGLSIAQGGIPAYR
jgi:hypothetical protein